MAIEIRNPSEDELRAAMQAGEAAFGEEQKDEDFERHRKMLPRERFYAAYDGKLPVGTTADFPFRLTVPGGELAAGGVTWVGVLPSHRRRGILRQMMRRQLDDLHERGEPLAVLWASEAAIYGRFGYGIAAPMVSLDARRDGFRFRDDPGPTGGMRLVTSDEAAELFPKLYDRVRREVPGMTARSSDWWTQYRLADPEHWRHGAGPKFYGVLELDGSVEAYTLYRIKGEWEGGFSNNQLRVLEAIATTPQATRELWRFLFGIDLVTKVQVWRLDPGSSLFLMVEDPRRLGVGLSDGLWLRLVDVEASLAGRSYATDGAVVFEVHDDLCPWNTGRWHVGETVERTKREPELELDVADLASAYLGAFDFHALARAERVRELKTGALERASALFRTNRPPYCSEDF